MKKISLLFACIGLLTFAANAQEPVKAKQTKVPVKVAPVENPTKAERVTPVAEQAPQSNTPAKAESSNRAKPKIVKYTKANATAVPVVKAGEAK